MNLKADAPFFEAAFNARLADKLLDDAYGIRRAKRDFELASVSRELIEKFSKRTLEIERICTEKYTILGARARKVVRETGMDFADAFAQVKGELGAETRQSKATMTLRQLRGEDFSDELDAPFSGHVVEVKVYLRGFEQNKGAKSVLADSIVETNPLTALLTYQYRPRKGIEVKKPGEADYEFIVFGGLDEKNRVAGEVRKYLAMVVLPALRDAETDLQTWKRSPLRPLLDAVRKLINAEKLKAVRDELDKATDALLAEPLITQLVTGHQ
jgi:TrwC relaxase